MGRTSIMLLQIETPENMQGNLFSRVDANNRKETEFDQIVANWGEVLSKRFLLSENLVQGGVESSISKPTS